jgi:hypothetical protein
MSVAGSPGSRKNRMNRNDIAAKIVGMSCSSRRKM